MENRTTFMRLGDHSFGDADATARTDEVCLNGHKHPDTRKP